MHSTSDVRETENPLCLRVEEAARLLGISRSKTYELVATGDIPSVEIGGLRRVPRAALERIVSTQAREEADGTSPGGSSGDA